MGTVSRAGSLGLGYARYINIKSCWSGCHLVKRPSGYVTYPGLCEGGGIRPGPSSSRLVLVASMSSVQGV